MMKRVFLTGISSGLGYGLAKVLIEENAAIYSCSRRALPPDLEAQQSINHQRMDLGQLDTISSSMQQWIPNQMQWDLVVLNAGLLGNIADLADTSMSEIRSVMDVNVWANKIVLDWLFGHGHQIKSVLAISSGASVNGHRGWSTYSISKAALNMMIKLYAAERPQTHFISLAPGLIDSEMQEFMYTKPDVNKFPSVQRLRDARYTEAMPGPIEAARKIINALPELEKFENGSFIDIRKI